MDRANKRSSLRMPPVGTAVAGQSKPSFFNCFIGEAQSTRKSVVQTSLLGNNGFCLKAGCSGTVHVLEMDRCLTSPCLAFPIYSLETRRLVKCNKCFYVSSLQAHLLNSRGSNRLAKKLPVVKLSKVSTKGEEKGGDSTQAVRPHHGFLGKISQRSGNGSSTTSDFIPKEPGAADKFRTFSIERSSAAESPPMHKETLQVSIPEPQNDTIPKYAQQLSPLEDPLSATEKEKDGGEMGKQKGKDGSMVGDPSVALTNQQANGGRRERDGPLVKDPTDATECWKKEVTPRHQNNTKCSREQRDELSQEPSNRQQCGQSDGAPRHNEGQSCLDDERNRLIGSLINRIENSGSTEDDALHLGRLIQRLKAKGGLDKLLETINGSGALDTGELQDNKVATLGGQGGSNRTTELPQWLFVKKGASADISALPSLERNAYNGNEQKYVGPPTSPSARHSSASDGVGGKFVVDPPISPISHARKKGMQEGRRWQERHLQRQMDASQHMDQSRASRRQRSQGDPSEIIQPFFSREEATQMFHYRDTGKSQLSPPSAAVPSDLVNYIARATKTDMKARDPSPRHAYEQQEGSRAIEEAGYAWGQPWKSSSCKASDPPMNDPPQHHVAATRQEPRGRKAKYLEPGGRRKISCPSQSSKLTNVDRKYKNREDRGKTWGGEKEKVDFVPNTDRLQQDAPVHSCLIPNPPQTPPHNRKQQRQGTSEGKRAPRLRVSMSPSESPATGLVDDDPYRDHYPASPMDSNDRNNQQFTHDTLVGNPVRATSPSKARARRQLSRQRSKHHTTSWSMPYDVPGAVPKPPGYLATPLSLPAVETGLTERSLARANLPSNDQIDKNVDDIIKETVTVMKSSITRSAIAPTIPHLPLS